MLFVKTETSTGPIGRQVFCYSQVSLSICNNTLKTRFNIDKLKQLLL